MTQAEPILNRFSDAFLAAMVEGSDPSSVLAAYEKTYPELHNSLHEKASALSMLYGYLETAEYPDSTEIATAYRTFAIAEAAPRSVKTESGFFASLVSAVRTPSFTYRFASGMAIVLLALFIWRPWSGTNSGSPAIPQVVSDVDNTPSNSPGASNPSGSVTTPGSGQTQTFRGTDNGHTPTTSPEDAARLKQLASHGELTAPEILSVTIVGNGQMEVKWAPVDGALSYVVELRSANDASFHPVTQVAHPSARIASPKSGASVSVRVIATSGQTKSPASDAKSIVVP